jgi:hypothetical protein
MKVHEKAPRTVRSAALGIQRDAPAISRCSGRHAVDPWLTNKDGKQEAKDDDEHEIQRHESDRCGPLRKTTVLPHDRRQHP